MTKYVKFNSEGKNAYEAPFEIEKDDKVIRGYNKPSNEAMLLQDGWLKYTGNAPLSRLYYENGEIKELPEPAPAPKTTFTKLQIRRCLRKHDLEDQLNAIISSDFEFKADWEDAQDIDLNDEMIQKAITSGFISQEMITLIQNECEVQ